MPSTHAAERSTLAEAADMIKFQHTVFALPFAVIALISSTGPAWPSPRTWLWVVVAMVAARTAAMAFNRLVDASIDAENPRTADRSLPAGRLSRAFVTVLVVVSVVLFFVAAGMLNRLCLWLAAPTLAVLLGYSYAKRFTSSAHLWLGVALGLAPLGAWLAGAGSPAWTPVVLGAAVALWVAGFDIIYSLQDEDFDRARGPPLDAGPTRRTSGTAAVAGVPPDGDSRFRRLRPIGRWRRDSLQRGCRRRHSAGVAAPPGGAGRSLAGRRRLLHGQRPSVSGDGRRLRLC
jgi:heme O synthase-like polyprenyltransferase